MSQVLCILASFFDLSAWVRKSSTGADQRKPKQCLFLLNVSLLHFSLLYGTGNHIKKKCVGEQYKVSLSHRPHLLQPQAQNFISSSGRIIRPPGSFLLQGWHSTDDAGLWPPRAQEHTLTCPRACTQNSASLAGQSN